MIDSHNSFRCHSFTVEVGLSADRLSSVVVVVVDTQVTAV